MAGPRKVEDEIVGQDSFLDVVANLVGIMIILVMVVGARAKDALVVAGMRSTEPPAAKAKLESEVAAAKAAADQVEVDFRRLEAQRKQQEIEAAYREGERNRVNLLVAAAERAVASQRQLLDESQRQEFDRRSEILAAESELADLQRGITHLENAAAETAIIDHLPTPMAKTVFGHEVHLRLHGGRVAYVPWDEFVARLKEEAPQRVNRLRDQAEFTDTIGPLGGFWMRYTLQREAQVLQGKVGMSVQQTVSLHKFVLLAESEVMGEPIAEALRDGSQLQTLLASHRPSATTITVWTYPDSFGEFRQLKRALFDRGYVTAARPLPADHPIGGSPEGTRSAAQ
jgi:hypothetical protein